MSATMQLTDWIPCTTPPVREGIYEVDFEGCDGSNPIFCEFANGEWPDRPGINLHLMDWKWRGVRRWVLKATHHSCKYGSPYQSYLTEISSRGVQRWSDRLQDALGFDDESAAMAYTRRRTLSPLGDVKAVLP